MIAADVLERQFTKAPLNVWSFKELITNSTLYDQQDCTLLELFGIKLYFDYVLQRAETTVPDRITGFIFFFYAKFLIHMYGSKLFDRRSRRKVDEIEAYFIASLTRFRVSLNQKQK